MISTVEHYASLAWFGSGYRSWAAVTRTEAVAISLLFYDHPVSLLCAFTTFWPSSL